MKEKILEILDKHSFADEYTCVLEHEWGKVAEEILELFDGWRNVGDFRHLEE